MVKGWYREKSLLGSAVFVFRLSVLLVTICTTRTNSRTKPKHKTQPTEQTKKEVVYTKPPHNNKQKKTNTPQWHKSYSTDKH